MLTSIELRNFKCFEQLELVVAPITVLIGPNGAGKSSVLQALALLRQSMGSNELRFNGPLVNAVGYEQIVFGMDKERGVGLGFSATAEIDHSPSDYYYTIRLDRDGRVQSIECRVGLGKEQFSIQLDPLSPAKETAVDNVLLKAQSTIGYPFAVGAARGGGSTVQERMSLFSKVAASIPETMTTWRFVSPLRGFMSPSYVFQRSSTDEIRLEASHETNSAGIASTLAIEDEVEETVASWVERVTGTRIRHKPDQNQQMGIVSTSPYAGRRLVPIVNEGFGTNQLVFMMFQIAKAPAGGMVGIEEPETHLHPLAVSKLGDLFVEIVERHKKQLILTTHSEHLLLSLLNNVAEGKLSSKDLKVQYFTRGEVGCGAAEVEVTPTGMTKGGLPGFFDAALEAQGRHLAAMETRQTRRRGAPRE